MSATTIWLLNRDAICDRYPGATPPEVEKWPQYERDVAIQLLNIRADAHKRRPKVN